MHEKLINHLFENKTEREMARDLVAALPSSMRQDSVERLLHELASPAPEGLDPQQAVDLITGFLAVDGIGNEAPAFESWLDAAAAKFGELPHEALIDSLWQDEDRRAEARHFANQWPGLDDARLEAILRRSAENDGKVAAGTMTLEQSRADVAKFMRDGAPADTAEKIGQWFDRTPSDDEPASYEVDTPRSPAPSGPTGPTREQLQVIISRGDAALLADAASQENRWYWYGNGSQEVLEARRQLAAFDIPSSTEELQ